MKNPKFKLGELVIPQKFNHTQTLLVAWDRGMGKLVGSICPIIGIALNDGDRVYQIGGGAGCDFESYWWPEEFLLNADERCGDPKAPDGTPEKPIKLEIYKSYKTRGGRKVVLAEHNPDQPFPFIGVLIEYNGHHLALTWREDGTFNLNENKADHNDIVAVWVDPLDFDWDCLPAWGDRSIAMDEDGKWFCYDTPTNGSYNGKWQAIGTCIAISHSFYPKNFTGNWKDSLFMNPKYKEVGK